MPSRRPLFAVVSLLFLAGCSLGEPFVDREYAVFSLTKPKLPGSTGVVNVCYGGDTPRERRDALAADICKVWGLEAVLSTTQRWQCRLTVPHLAVYACVDPAMRWPNGSYVNPFVGAQVNAWRRAHPEAVPSEPAAPPSSGGGAGPGQTKTPPGPDGSGGR